MKYKLLGVGIIGTGSIADIHFKSINELENCELIAVCSSNSERAKIAEKKYRVPAYVNYDEICRLNNIDLIIICTETGRHLEPTIAAAKFGKHVLTEKPLEVTIERAEQMINVCKNSNVKLGCIFQNRFNDGFIKLKEAVEKGDLGKLIMGNAFINWYRKPEYYSSSKWKGTIAGDGGAALINQSIHTIDLLLDIMGDVKSVYGKVKTVFHDIEGEDLGLALLNFKNGSSGLISGATSLYPGYPERLEIFGEKGSVILESGKITEWNLQNFLDHVTEKKNGISSGSSDPMAIDYINHKRQIKDMADAICEDRTPLIDGAEGLKSLQLVKTIYKSSELQKEIHLP